MEDVDHHRSSEHYEKDIADLFIGFYPESQSLEFEEVDFGLWSKNKLYFIYIVYLFSYLIINKGLTK